MRIGIHVAWARQEAAYMAGQIADVATKLGHTVSILSTQPCEGSVYPRWDHEVLSHKHDFQHWAARQKTVIYFDVQPEKMQLVSDKQNRNVLVMLWHRIAKPDLNLLGRFDRIVCPNRSTADHAISRFNLGTYAVCPWDPLTELLRLPLENKTEQRSVFVPFDGPTVKRAGTMLLHGLQMVAEANPKVRFTVGQSQRWPRNVVQTLSETLKAFPKQFTVLKRREWLDWQRAILESDWLFDPSLEPNSCTDILQATYLRRPIIAFDVPPINELLRDGRTGTLIPCELTEDHWGVPAARPLIGKLTATLDSTLHDARLARRYLEARDTSYMLNRRRSFELFWQQLLEKTAPWV